MARVPAHTLRSLAVAAVTGAMLAVTACASGTPAAVPAPMSAQPVVPSAPPKASATPSPRPTPTGEATPEVPRSTTKPVALRAMTTFAPTPSTAPTTTSSTDTPRRTVRPAPPGSVDCSVAKCVALTFDDGPGPHTTRLLGALTREGARATFFMQGGSIRANPGIARQVANMAGMEIGDHSATHAQLTSVGSAQLRREVVGNHATIQEITGKDVTLFRPPYGARNSRVDAMAAEAGEAVILWDVDTLDWQTRSASATRRAVADKVTSGSIVLMHDIHGSTVDAVPGIITDLKDRGYTLVTVSELLDGSTAGRVYTRR
jgi:peptidoglycan/xylan/chitin deacetylase (PgdA/CDA1 family)